MSRASRTRENGSRGLHSIACLIPCRDRRIIGPNHVHQTPFPPFSCSFLLAQSASYHPAGGVSSRKSVVALQRTDPGGRRTKAISCHEVRTRGHLPAIGHLRTSGRNRLFLSLAFSGPFKRAVQVLHGHHCHLRPSSACQIEPRPGQIFEEPMML